MSKHIADHLKGKRVLILAGYLSDEMELNSKKLADYIAGLAGALNAPVAATANSVMGLKSRGVKASKKLAIEMVTLLGYEKWKDPIMAEKPEVVVFIGYPPKVARALVTATKGVQTVALGNTCIQEADFSLPDASLQGYAKNLEELIQELGGWQKELSQSVGG